MVSRIIGMFKRKGDDLDCDDVKELSSDYIDEDLKDARVSQMGRHLGWCGPCNAFVKTLRATVGLLRATPKQEAPDGFRDRVRENLRKNADKT